MRIGDQCGRTVRRQNSGQLRRTDHRRFYVHMCVNQSGNDDFPGHIQLLQAVIAANSGNYAAANGNIGGLYLTCKNVDK